MHSAWGSKPNSEQSQEDGASWEGMMTTLPPEFPSEGPRTPSYLLLVMCGAPILVRLAWGRTRF